MKTKPFTILVLAASAGVSWAAVSLDVTKPPVNGGFGAGPVQDPNAIQGQWFAKGGARTNEFYDNAQGSGGGFASTTAIFGRVTNVTYDGGGGIIAFTLDASITNDTIGSIGQWAGGSNSHNENLTTTVAYVGTMYSTKLVAEFALSDLANQPNNWQIPADPYTQMLPEIVATNENDTAWYCYSTDLANPGNYYVPAWDYGDIGIGQTVTKQLSFTVNGSLTALDPRFAAITSSLLNGSDILSNRTTSLKISNWVDTLAIDGVGGGGTEEPLLSSNASVFHNTIPEASTATLVALTAFAAMRRRRS